MARALLEVQPHSNRLRLTGRIETIPALSAYGISILAGGNYSLPKCILSVNTLLKNIEDLTFSDEVQKWYDRELQHISNVTEIRKSTLPLQTGYLNDTLFEYQRTMVHFGKHAKHFINADDRGLGKTLEAISLAVEAGCKRILVVSPNYLKLNWMREIKKFSNFQTFCTNTSERAARERVIESFVRTNEGILIVNYEMLRIIKSKPAFKDLFEVKWDMVIFDEAHRLKGRNSLYVTGAKKFSKVEYIQMLTGNPISNRPEDIWQLLNILYPEQFTSYWNFVEYFCNILDNYFGREIKGIKEHKIPELQALLLPILLKRLKEDVAELPDKIREYIYVDMEGNQLKQYRTLEKQMAFELANGKFELAATVPAQHIKLQQLIASPSLLGVRSKASAVEDTCMNLVEELMQSTDKVIIGTWFTGAAKNLIEMLSKKFKVFNINSSMNSTLRDAEVEAFKNCNTPSILIGTIKTMSEGLNIDECDYMILCDLSWVPTDNEQFEDRIHRITSTRKKTYYYITVKDSISEDRIEVLNSKVQMRDEVLFLKETTEKLLSRVGIQK